VKTGRVLRRNRTGDRGAQIESVDADAEDQKPTIAGGVTRSAFTEQTLSPACEEIEDRRVEVSAMQNGGPGGAETGKPHSRTVMISSNQNVLSEARRSVSAK